MDIETRCNIILIKKIFKIKLNGATVTKSRNYSKKLEIYVNYRITEIDIS